LEEIVAAPVKKTENTTGGIRCADHATPSIRKSWYYFAKRSLGRLSLLADQSHGVFKFSFTSCKNPVTWEGPNVNSLCWIKTKCTINRMSNDRVDPEQRLSAICSWNRWPTDAISILSDIHPKASSHNGDIPWLAVAYMDSELKDKPILLQNLVFFPFFSPVWGLLSLPAVGVVST
jgi:hypothetical protein